MLKASVVVLALIGLVACTCKPAMQEKTVKPQSQDLQKATQKGTAKEYICKGGNIIRIVRHTTKNKKGRLNSINLTFNNVTRTLSPTIAENGRNYSNIHWVWLERKEFSTLKTSVGEVLAEQCVLR